MQLTQLQLAECIPVLSPQASKGVNGRPLLAVGSSKYHGAAILCALACSRAGSDYTYLITHGDKLTVVSQASPDIITRLHKDCDADYIRKLPFTSILVGSGLDRNEDASKLFFEAVEAANARQVPLIVDADGLYFLAVVLKNRPDAFRSRSKPLILTPNSREFAALYQKLFGEEPVAYVSAFAAVDVQGRFVKVNVEQAVLCVKRVADQFDCLVVVKNVVDIAAYRGQIKITQSYGQVKRASGQGDVLAGVIACMVNWGSSVLNQVICACEIVKRCAAKAYAKKYLGTVAADIIQEIPEVMHELAPDHMQTFELEWE